MSETTFLDEAHRDRQWQSTLTGALYRWEASHGWLIHTEIAAWHPVRAGWVTPSVYARAGEKFEEVTP